MLKIHCAHKLSRVDVGGLSIPEPTIRAIRNGATSAPVRVWYSTVRVARATAAQRLAECVERGFVSREGHRYAATPRGLAVTLHPAAERTLRTIRDVGECPALDVDAPDGHAVNRRSATVLAKMGATVQVNPGVRGVPRFRLTERGAAILAECDAMRGES